MVEKVIRALVILAVAALCFFLVMWVLAEIGFGIPPRIQNILLVIAILLVILYLWRLFGSDVKLP